MMGGWKRALAICSFAGSHIAVVAGGSTESFCKKISERLSSISYDLCISAEFQPDMGRASVKGHSLMVRDVPARSTNSKSKSNALRIMLIGGIHGDELASISIAFLWMSKIAGPDGADFHWRVIPLANPDGFFSSPSRRTNANGVDLNRNFGSHDWSARALKHWEDKTKRDPRRYPGRSPASEPETQWLQDQISDFRPDVILALHAPYGILDFDGLPVENHPRQFGILRPNRLGVFPGSLGNYAGVDRNTPVITLEFSSARVIPSQQNLAKVWLDMTRWLKRTQQLRLASYDLKFYGESPISK